MPDFFSFPTPAALEAQDRRRQMLRTAFGPAIAAALAEPTVIEVMVNPDGRLWIDRAAAGRTDSGERVGATETERIIRLVAAHVRREVTDKAPIVSAELPDSGERFEGVMPPVAPAPCFAIRKPADVPYRLADYVAARILTPPQAHVLAEAVREKRNIVVAGGTSSGKTTLVNSLLASCQTAIAADSGMPWEAPLQRILESIEGPVAKVIAVVTIILTGLSLSFGDMGGAFRRMVQVVFGLSIDEQRRRLALGKAGGGTGCRPWCRRRSRRQAGPRQLPGARDHLHRRPAVCRRRAEARDSAARVVRIIRIDAVWRETQQ